ARSIASIMCRPPRRASATSSSRRRNLTGAPTVERHPDADGFLHAAEGWLSASEAENNLLLGVALGAKGRAAVGSPPPYWATVRSDSQIVGCVCRTPPYRLVLSRLPSAAIDALVADVAALYGTLNG